MRRLCLIAIAAALSATVRHPSAALRRAGLLNPRFLRLGSLPPSVRILYLRRTFRAGGSVHTVLLFVVINRASPTHSARAFAAGNPPPPQVQAPPNDEPPDAALRIVELFAGFANDERTYNQVHIEEPTAFITSGLAVNVDLFKSAMQVKQVRKVIDNLFNGHTPTDTDVNEVGNENGKTDPGLDTGHFDDGHAFGWTAPKKKATLDMVAQLGLRPDKSTFEVEITIKSDINNDGRIGAPDGPPPPTHQLYKFSFGPLGLTFDDTVPVPGGTPVVEHWSVQIQGGTACGTSVSTAAFEVPWTLSVNGGAPQQRTAQESFAVNRSGSTPSPTRPTVRRWR